MAPRFRLLSALFLLAFPAPAAAQSAVETGGPPVANARVFPFLGLRAGTPQTLSVTAGIGLGLDPGVEPDRPSQELLFDVAPGVGAERASVTYVYSTGRFGSGVAGGLSVLRTVSHPWNAPANTTYAGVDVAVLPIIAIGPRVGLLRRLTGNTADRGWLWTIDFGFGF